MITPLYILYYALPHFSKRSVLFLITAAVDLYQDVVQRLPVLEDSIMLRLDLQCILLFSSIHHHDYSSPNPHQQGPGRRSPVYGKPLGDPKSLWGVCLLLHVSALFAITHHSNLQEEACEQACAARLCLNSGFLQPPVLHRYLLLPQ